MPGKRMEEITALARSHGLPVISDEIYHGLVYEGTAHSILEFTDRAFVFNGFSKLYAMTGFRLGYGRYDDDMVLTTIGRTSGRGNG